MASRIASSAIGAKPPHDGLPIEPRCRTARSGAQLLQRQRFRTQRDIDTHQQHLRF
jgi:hypothetical protein